MSAFWVKKMKTYFARIDLNADGKISRDDFLDMAEKFIAGGYVKSDQEAFKGNICGIWDKYLSGLGADLTEEGFVKAMQTAVASDGGKATLSGVLSLFFKAVDTDGDAQISAGEFELFFKIIGLGAADSLAAFKAIDENSDDQLSEEEFTTAGLDFFVNQAESTAQLFWGPLKA